MLFIAFVPHAQVKHNSREEAALRNTQKEPGGEKPRKVLGETHEGANDSPYEGEGGKPEPRRRALENDITWDFEQDITDEPDTQRREILVPGLCQTAMRVVFTRTWKKLTHVCISGETLDTSISNCEFMSTGRVEESVRNTVASIQEGEKKEESQRRDKMPVDFPQELLLVNRIFSIFQRREGCGRSIVNLWQFFLFGHG